MNTSGSRVLITGGSLGIGRATARILKEAGAKVLVTGRSEDRLEKVKKELGVETICADVAQETDVLKTYAAVKEKLGGLDCLVNNAGIGCYKPLAEVTAHDMERVWRTNVLGSVLMGREAAKIFMEQKSGNIVNICSTAATKGYEKGTVYASSKFALRGISECWRAELRRYNVRVITINPSYVSTAFGSEERVEKEPEENKLSPIEIAHSIKAALEMDDRGFVTELTVFATNPL